MRETLADRFNVNYLAYVVCPRCGADNSQRPPLGWRLKYGLKLARKRVKAYGWRWFLFSRINHPWECWQMPYERADAPHKLTKRSGQAASD